MHVKDDSSQQAEPAETQFSADIEALFKFQDYFKEKEKIAILVGWLNEELGLEKGVASLAVKHIAPFILAKVAKATEKVSQSWLNKLQDKLSEYSWYAGLTSKLLHVLKTRTDQSYEKVLQSPSNENLKALRQSSQWHNLKSEQQGLLQLLIGQQEANTQHTKLLEKLDQVTGLLSFQLDLKSVEFIQSNASSADLGSALWLTYARQQTELVGREAELTQLNEFYHQAQPFSWWAITGAGGLGKSRLALDSIASVQHSWDVGFLSFDKLDATDKLSKWQPLLPTIIVIDYAAERAQRIAQWLDDFIQHQHQYNFPVRVLVLERSYQGLSWWEDITSGSKDGLTRKQHLFGGQPLELQTLTKPQQQQVLANFLDSLQASNKLPAPENPLWETIHKLTHQGSPLYLGMVAIAVSQGNISDVRQWQHQDLLSEVLQHEKRVWQRLLKKQSDSRRQQIANMLALASMTGGLDWTKDETRLYQGCVDCQLGNNDQEIEENWQWVQKLVGNTSGQLQPDLIAEFFLLNQWTLNQSSPSRLSKQRVKLAFQLSTPNTLAFISRCATDFKEDSTSLNWVKHLMQTCTAETIAQIEQTIFDVVGMLALIGKYSAAFNDWLPLLEQSNEPKIQGKRLNLQGKLCLDLAKYDTALDYLKQSLAIQQEIGDKAGEGTTLNNISQIYDARGDYDTALDYLKQSLAIRQEIGDKAGEGTTLNNISQIYDARGDYDTALDYLKQSLAIRQEIGDKAGEGTTLNNISQIFIARGDYDTALDYLKQSLAIRQEIGDKAGEGTTLNNLATTSYARGDYDTALDYLKQSLAIQQEIGDKAGEGTTLNNISQIFIARGDYDTALDYLKQSLAIQQEIGDKAGEGTTLNNISQIFIARGDYDTAPDYLKQSLAIQQEIGDKAGEGTTLNNISQIFIARGDYDTALDYLKQSLAIQQEIGDKAGACATLFNIGHIYAQKSDVQQALGCWLQVYRWAMDLKLAQALVALENLAPAIGLEEGLAGWQRLIEQSEKLNE